MSFNPEALTECAAQIASAGAYVHRRGWTPATSGNLSMRLDREACAITASGSSMGALSAEDIVAVDLDGRALVDSVPSAETVLHARLYRRNPDIGAVLHTHSTMATVVTRQCPDTVISVAGYELEKAFRGVISHERELVFPVFENSQNVPALAGRVDRWMDDHGTGYAYLIRGHGVYTWGRDMPECLRHLEALEFLLDCEWRIRSVQSAAARERLAAVCEPDSSWTDHVRAGGLPGLGS